jgi:predicted amidophosphoribosyltransferase
MCLEKVVGEDALDDLAVLGFYHDPRLRQLIHSLKYQGARCVLPEVTRLMRRWRNSLVIQPPWFTLSQVTLQAVIAAPERVRERGFDQAELIVELVRREWAPLSPVGHLLERDSSLVAQATLEHDAVRQANIRGKYTRLSTGSMPSAVLLIDDVITTGSTMREAARVLRKSGVQTIYGFALALGA